jgi:hypothetical protein
MKGAFVVLGTIAVVVIGFAVYQQQETQVLLVGNSHPTRSGTYLAACVFYAALFGESPEGLEYTGGLGSGEAAILQSIAAETVLQDPTRWHLPDSVGNG